MSTRIALEIAAELDFEDGIVCREAAQALRDQHAEIERLKAQLTQPCHEHDMLALSAAHRICTDFRESSFPGGDCQRQAVVQITVQDAIASAVAAEREACASVCESEADKSGGWEKVRLIEMANRMRRDIRARAKP